MRTVLSSSVRILAALTICGSLRAQTEKPTLELPGLIADRPEYTDVVEVVGPGVIQTEHGITLERNGGVRSLTTPELLLRIGLTKRIELRLGSAGFLMEKSAAGTAEGRSGSEIGAKINLFEETHFAPGLSIIPSIFLPSGDRRFSSLGYDPGVRLALEKNVPAGFTLGGNVTVSSLTSEEGRFFQRAASGSAGHNLAGGFAGFTEVFGFLPGEKGGKPAWSALAGVTHGIGKNAEVDARVGKQLSEIGPNWFVGVGFAVRRPLPWFTR
jgi:hypothetical protein